jgi:hypothetical protein
MIFNRRKSFELYLNEEQTYWKGIDSLVNYVEDSDLAIKLPIRYFEHLVIIKAWHSLTQMITNNLVKEELVVSHCSEAKHLFPFVDIVPLQAFLSERKKLIDEIIGDACEDLTIKDLVPDDSVFPPPKMEDLLAHNKLVSVKSEEIEKQCIEKARLITDTVLQLRMTKETSLLLLEANEIVESISQ